MPPSKSEAHAALKFLIATLKADDPRRNELSLIYLLLWLIDGGDGNRTNSLAGVLGGAYGQGGAKSLLEEVITIMRWVANGGDIWTDFLAEVQEVRLHADKFFKSKNY